MIPFCFSSPEEEKAKESLVCWILFEEKVIVLPSHV